MPAEYTQPATNNATSTGGQKNKKYRRNTNKNKPHINQHYYAWWPFPRKMNPFIQSRSAVRHGYHHLLIVAMPQNVVTRVMMPSVSPREESLKGPSLSQTVAKIIVKRSHSLVKFPGLNAA
ncbi:unnamed protein product, partial [Ectocarpus sp. 8 AP-2014]